ncbi:MAG: OmcA/MtrC family decaheme c-type cytochrome [Thermoanaerobaculales bacterium]
MALIHCGIVLVAASAALAPSHQAEIGIHRVLRGTSPAHYATSEAEHYLTAEQIAYIRPGLNIVVGGVQIGTDLKPVADVTFTDDGGQPLDRAGVLTPGALSISFVLSWWDPATRYYTDYFTRAETDPVSGRKENQASTASGTWEDLTVGHAKFHFTSVLPASYDVTKTHTLGIYATRAISLTDPIVISKTYIDNVEFDFRPDSKPVTDTWNKMTTATCNQCHDPLGAHGGSRADIKLCVLCHSAQTVDAETGNTVDARVFIHKIHMGSSLPSVKAGHPYQIVGHNNAVSDYSTVVFPQDIRNCTTCHKADSPQGFAWYTYPSRAACGSCHDDIDWTSGANHPAGPQADDSACAACHQPQGENEWDASIQNAHIVPTNSSQLKGLNIHVTNVANTAPGSKPTVTFNVTNGDGSAVDPTTLGALTFYLSGPTTDYALFPALQENGKTATASGNAWTFTFQTSVIPADAVGTWVLTADLYRTVTFNPAPRNGPATLREPALNPIYYFAVTDSQAVARRTVVDINKCNVCHNALSHHGGRRLKTQMCVICHNPNGNDAAHRTPAQLPAETIHFKYLIHRIHTGDNTSFDFNVSGTDFSGIRFPGDRRDCLKCHADVAAGAQQTFELPLPDSVLPTPTLRNPYLQLMQPTAAACLACHDTQAAAAHAATMTTSFGEACEVCHGADDEFSVSRVHAR